MSISSGSVVVEGDSWMVLLLRWSVTLARRVRILRSSSVMGPVLVTMLGWTSTVGSPNVSSARDRIEL